MNTSVAKPRISISWRLLYAFTVVWLAAFTALSPIARREPVQFRSTAELRYAIDPDNHFTKAEIQSLLKSAVSRVADPSNLSLVRSQVPVPMNIKVALGTDDVHELRSRLSVGQLSRGNGIQLAVSFRGRGGIDDREFVNQLANKLAIEIPRVSETMTSTDWIKSTTSCLDMSRQVHLAEQIRAEVAQINTAVVDLKERLSSSDPGAVATQIEVLERQKAELRKTNGFDSTHPQIVQLQQKIEELRAGLYGDPEFRPVQVGATPSGESTDTVKNHFYQASVKTTVDADPPSSLVERLSQIDLSRIGSAATQLKTNAEAIHDLKRDLDTVLNQPQPTTERPFASLASVNYSKSPTLLIGSKPAPIWLLIIPCCIATLITMYYNPIRDRMQMKTTGDVSRTMKLDVIGALPSGNATVISRPERWSARSVRTAEYSLIVLGFVLLFMGAVNPQVFSVALANPLLALSNWYWLIVG